MKQGNAFRRKQYFVARRFQLRYVGLILALTFFAALMCSYVIYYTMMVTMGDKLASVYPQGRLMAIVKTVNIQILMTMLLAVPFITVIGIYASHRIAGPIGRIEGFLGSMAAGDFTQVLVLRKNDELINLGRCINGVVESTKSTMKKEKAAISNISVSMENLRKLGASRPVDNDTLVKALDKLNDEVSVLREEVEKYKI